MLTLGLANGTDRYADKTWPIDGWAGTATPGGAASGEHTTWGPALQAPEPRGRLQIKVGTPAYPTCETMHDPSAEAQPD